MKFIAVLLTGMIIQSCGSQTIKNQVDTSSKNNIIVSGNGDVIKIQKTVGKYSGIILSGSVDVVLTEGKVGDITIEAAPELIDWVEVENIGEDLNITMKKGKRNISAKKNVVVYIPIDKLERIKSSGSGDIYVKKDVVTTQLSVETRGSGDIAFKKIKSDKFFIKTSGSGDFLIQELNTGIAEINVFGSSDFKINLNAESTKLKVSGSSDLLLIGKTNDLDVVISGSSDAKLDKLLANQVNVTVSGAGDVIVSADKTIKAQVSGSGSIYYIGEADLVSQKISGIGTIKKYKNN